jgi:hypothetical protein
MGSTSPVRSVDSQRNQWKSLEGLAQRRACVDSAPGPPPSTVEIDAIDLIGAEVPKHQSHYHPNRCGIVRYAVARSAPRLT